MAIVDIEPGLQDIEEEVRDTAHRFAEEVMRPAGATLDRLADPADVIASGSVLWSVFEKYRGLGLQAIEEDPTVEPATRARIQAIVAEELGWGDSGLAVSLGVAAFPRLLATMSGNQSLVDRFDDAIGCWAVTEPDHGSDVLAFTERPFRDPSLKPNCVARVTGDELEIRGQKSAWVSNGSVATAAALFCTLDAGQGFAGGCVVLVPLDLPGVSRGQPLDKLGQRALNQGEIFFDGVRVPLDHLVVPPELYPMTVELVLSVANAGMGTIFVGVARAALEHATAYAHSRVQGGVPIFEHQSVRSRLFKMFMKVEAARALARRVAVFNALNPPLIQYSIASKVFSTTTAFEVASEAVQIFGGNGLSRTYPVEKLLRDARASMIEDGCNEVLGLVGASRL
ncbi:MAG: acyl-CoA dehydrogenase family protein [Acidimicrobiales bacterium]|jgi:alkylation response protein AidB-like acyl-CoA dehydrogenase